MSGRDEIPQKVCDRERIIELEDKQSCMLQEIEILLSPKSWSQVELRNYAAACKEELLIAIRATREVFPFYRERQSYWFRLKSWLRNVRNR